MLKNMGRALLEADRSGARGHGGNLQVSPDLAFEDEPRRDGWCQRCALEQRTNDGWCDGRGRFEVAGILAGMQPGGEGNSENDGGVASPRSIPLGRR
jgi:hypothetical protein